MSSLHLMLLSANTQAFCVKILCSFYLTSYEKKNERMCNSLLQYLSLFITFSIDTLHVPRVMQPSTFMTSLLTYHVLNPTDDIVFQLISFTSKAAIHLSMFPFSYLLSHVLLFSVCKSQRSVNNVKRMPQTFTHNTLFQNLPKMFKVF